MPASNVAIMKIIDASTELTAKWNKMTTTLETELEQQFFGAMGVQIPSIAAPGVHVRTVKASAQFASQGTADSFLKGVPSLMGNVFEENWPKVALDATNLITSVINAAYVHGELTEGFQGNGQQFKVPDKSNPDKTNTFVVANYMNSMIADASQWGTNESFYGIIYVVVIWQPSAQEYKMLKV